MKINTLIVDDEKLARERIRSLLESHPDIAVIGECNNGKEAIQKISSTLVDLMFLDIQMPELDGIRLIEKLPNEKIPLVVFTTAYDEFAVKAFELNAIDYLLKPFTKKRFEQSVKKIRDEFNSEDKDLYVSQMAAMAKAILDKKIYTERIVVKSDGKIRFQPVAEIVWAESEGNYLTLHTNSESSVIRDTMANFSVKLDPTKFLRIHRSFLVNVEYIKELKPWFNDEYVIILKDRTQLPVGRTYRKSIHSFFKL